VRNVASVSTTICMPQTSKRVLPQSDKPPRSATFNKVKVRSQALSRPFGACNGLANRRLRAWEALNESGGKGGIKAK